MSLNGRTCPCIGWMIGIVLASLVLSGCGPSDSAIEARELIKARRTEEAIMILREILARDPDQPELQFLYGRALSIERQYGLAEWPFRKAMEDPEWRNPAAMELARLSIASLNPETAIEVLTPIIEERPHDIRALLMRAQAFADTRIQIDAALSDVERVFVIDPKNEEARRIEILAYLNGARTEEAGKALQRLGEQFDLRDPGSDSASIWYCVTMSLFAQESHEIEIAETRWNQCVANFPTDPGVISKAAAFFGSIGASDRQRQILEEAVVKSDLTTGIGFRVRLAQLLLSWDEIDEAIELIQAGLGSDDPAVQSLYLHSLSSLYAALDRPEEALAAAEKAFEIDRRAREIPADQLLVLADLAARSGKTERALEIARTLEVPAYQTLIRGRVSHERGDLEEAIAAYDQAAVLWPDNEFIRYHAARALEAIGDFDRALELYRHTIRINPEMTTAHLRIARIRAAEGNIALALDALAAQSARRELELEAELLLIELAARVNPPDIIFARLSEVGSRFPDSTALGLSSGMKGYRLAGHPEVAVELLEIARGHRLATADAAPVLAELVRSARDASRLGSIRASVESALARMPDSAELQAVHALFRESFGEDLAGVARAYHAVLEANPRDPVALAGLARLTAAEDPGGAFDAAQSALRLPRVDRGEIHLVGLALENEADGRDRSFELFTDLLKSEPTDGVAARHLLAHTLEHPETLSRWGRMDLVRRARRFAPSAATDDLARRAETALSGDESASQ